MTDPVRRSDNGVPLLGIRHWLVFMTLVGLGFTIQRRWLDSAPWPPSFVIISAAALTGSFVLLFNRDSGGRAFRASGHWLVVLHAAFCVLWIPFQILVPPSLDDREAALGFVMFHASLAALMAVAAVFNKRGWRWMFGGQAVIEVYRSLFFILLLLENTTPLFERAMNATYAVNFALSIVMFGMAAYEVQTRQERDWVHILGMGVVCYPIIASATHVGG